MSAHTSLRVEAPVRPLMACPCLILLDAFPSLLAACLACPLLLRAPPPSPTSAFWEPFKRVPSNAGFWELPSSLPMCLSPNMRYTTFGCPSAPPLPSPCRGPKSRTTPQAARPLYARIQIWLDVCPSVFAFAIRGPKRSPCCLPLPSIVSKPLLHARAKTCVRAGPCGFCTVLVTNGIFPLPEHRLAVPSQVFPAPPSPCLPRATVLVEAPSKEPAGLGPLKIQCCGRAPQKPWSRLADVVLSW